MSFRRSISGDNSRHGIIDKRAGKYLCFPDVIKAGDGSMNVVYREADQHVAAVSRLLQKTSHDSGRTWGKAVTLNAQCGHCPRISEINGGELIIIDDLSKSLYRSRDNGRGYIRETLFQSGNGPLNDAPLMIPDRIMQNSGGRLSTVSQVRLGTYKLSRYPTTNQAQWVNMFYVSEDNAATWQPVSVVSGEKDLSLCEVSICGLPDGRLLSVSRENTGVYEPMYVTMSEDDGLSWSGVIPTPLIGHRPCVGVTSDGRLLVTYRSVAPERATCAWLGSLEELCGDFLVHGSDWQAGEVALKSDGLYIKDSGVDNFFALRPVSNPFTATARLELDIKVTGSGSGQVRFGGAIWHIGGEKISSDDYGVSIRLEKPENHLAFELDRGTVNLLVNGASEYSHHHTCGKETRAIAFGRIGAPEGEAKVGVSVWNNIRLKITEPSYLREYNWSWNAAGGRLPDDESRKNILELKNARYAWGGDYGYSGWTELSPGEFYCAYHHIDEKGEKTRDSYVMGTRFFASDFEAEVNDD